MPVTKPTKLTRAMVEQAKTRQPFRRTYLVQSPDPNTIPGPVEVYATDIDGSGNGQSYRGLLDSCTDKKGKAIQWRADNFTALLAAHTFSDADGQPLLTEDDIRSGDWDRLYRGYRDDLMRLAVEHNKYAAGNLGEQEKNSDEGDANDSVSASPSSTGTAM